MAIQRGDLVDVTTADDQVVRMKALSGPVRGRDFPILWVCSEAEWQRAELAGEDAEGIPWPVQYVQQMVTA